MKFNLRITGLMIFVFLFLTFSVFSTANFVEASADNEEQIRREIRVLARAKIPIFQRLEIIEEPNINYSYLMNNYNGSKEIVIEEALTLNILSNTKWHLRLNNKNLNSKIMIRKNNQSDYQWQNLNSTTAKFSGENGVHQVTFDLKFILDQSSRTAIENLALDLRHSLVPELY